MIFLWEKFAVMQRPPHAKLALGSRSLRASARSGNLTSKIVLKWKYCIRHFGIERIKKDVFLRVNKSNLENSMALKVVHDSKKHFFTDNVKARFFGKVISSLHLLELTTKVRFSFLHKRTQLKFFEF